MSERGVESPGVRGDPVAPSRRPGPPARRGGNPWQVVAIIAIVAATAGWTAAGILAFREPSTAAVESPTDSFDPNATDDSSIPPVADTHDAPELEAFLPTELNGNALQLQSWDGSGVLTDDTWSASMTSFLTAAGKKPADLRVAQAYDPNEAIDASIGLYRVDGVAAGPLRDALIAAWKGDYPDMKVSEVTLGGKTVTKAEFGQDAPNSFMYLRDDMVYDIETADDAIATAALAALPASGASSAPAVSASPAP